VAKPAVGSRIIQTAQSLGRYTQNLFKIYTMIKIKTLLLLICLTTTFFSYSQFRSDNIGGYIFSLRVDSSNNFIIGEQPNKNERVKYALEDKVQGLSSYSYSSEVKAWSNVYVYNDSTLKLLKVFDLPILVVYPVYEVMSSLKSGFNNYYRGLISGITKEHIIYAVKTDKYNGNGIIDSDDPVYLFASRKDGTECKQISPEGMNVTGWRLIKGGMGIILTVQPDLNGDKRFLEDEVLYEIDLNTDISRIKSRILSKK
jgi:hypothetical protein